MTDKDEIYDEERDEKLREPLVLVTLKVRENVHYRLSMYKAKNRIKTNSDAVENLLNEVKAE